MAAGRKGKVVLVVVVGLALSTSISGIAGAEKGEAGRVVSTTFNENRPQFTEAEKALIGGKCGYAPGEWNGRRIHMHDGVLECGNGRTVDDPEVRAVMTAFSARVRAHVDSVMKQVRVKRAINREAMLASREAMRDAQIARRTAHARAMVDARMALRDADRAHIQAIRAEAAATRARAIADSIDVESIRWQVDEALERGLGPLDRDE